MTSQDDRVWGIEQLIRKEGFLDNRMYECAQQCAISGRPETKEELYTSWELWRVHIQTEIHSIREINYEHKIHYEVRRRRLR